ncbi:hypothetical protein C2E23DRAFT_505612 [Lenzites betulinus]|nr:hypothetical protein C2E23DRAFT_505612 [Lenzites betulinus]
MSLLMWIFQVLFGILSLVLIETYPVNHRDIPDLEKTSVLRPSLRRTARRLPQLDCALSLVSPSDLQISRIHAPEQPTIPLMHHSLGHFHIPSGLVKSPMNMIPFFDRVEGP